MLVFIVASFIIATKGRNNPNAHQLMNYWTKWSLSIQWNIAAKSLQSCATLCDPIDGSPPGSPSLGFSRQEQWSGLPFPTMERYLAIKRSEILIHVMTLDKPWKHTKGKKPVTKGLYDSIYIKPAE